MSFSNENFQIFFNRTPCLRQDNNGPHLSPVQNNTNTLEHVKRFTFSTGGIYQTNADSIEPQNLSTTHIHATHNDGTNYSSGQGTDLSSNEALDYFDGYQVSAHKDAEDDDEKEESLGLSSNSRKIKKDNANHNIRSVGSKKAMLDAYKIKTKRNPWQPEEDEQVIDLVAKYGQSWALIASLMKLRSGKQIRDRYLNKLKPDINKAEWTDEEDDLLMVLCRKLGHKWSRIATQLPGRTEGQVKNRFYSHIKKRMPKWNGVPEGDFEEEGEEDTSSLNEEDGLLKQLQSESPMIKQEIMVSGLEKDRKATQRSVMTIQGLNCAGNYKFANQAEEQPKQVKGPQMTFGSLNIRINTVNQPSTVKKEEKFIYPTPSRKGSYAKSAYNLFDPTDVISYDSVANMNLSDAYCHPEEVASPYSAVASNMNMASTRASSLQDPEFEEVFGRMGNNLAKLQPLTVGNPNKISFSITNGNIFKNNTSSLEAVKPINFRGTAAGALNNVVKMEDPYVKGLKAVNQLDFSSGSSKINLKIC